MKSITKVQFFYLPPYNMTEKQKECASSVLKSVAMNIFSTKTLSLKCVITPYGFSPTYKICIDEVESGAIFSFDIYDSLLYSYGEETALKEMTLAITYELLTNNKHLL